MAHKVVNVPVVQGYKEVGIVVFGTKLGGSVLCAVVSRSLKFRDGAPVSGLANMPATNTAGTYEDIVGEVGVVKRVAEDDISHGGSGRCFPCRRRRCRGFQCAQSWMILRVLRGVGDAVGVLMFLSIAVSPGNGHGGDVKFGSAGDVVDAVANHENI